MLFQVTLQLAIGLETNFFGCKIVNIFLPLVFKYVFGAQKNRLIQYPQHICFC